MIGLSLFVSLAANGRLTMLGGLVLSHLVAIVGPSVVLAWFLTADPARTLRLRWPRVGDLLLAAGIAVAIHPLVREIGYLVGVWFPISSAKQALLEQFQSQIPGLGMSVLVLALMPAITEELAFRGYILSGLERSYRPSTAILFSAFLFAFLHAIISLFQQFFPAALLGLILGTIAYRTGSLWPGALLHFVSNSLVFVLPEIVKTRAATPWLGWAFRDSGHLLFQLPIVIGGVFVASVCLAAIWHGHRVRDLGRGGLMGDPSGTRTLGARWIFPGTSPPISDGRITIADGRIVRVGGAESAFPVDLDLGDVAIVPGFVNAHTHLELGPIPWEEATGPENEVEWLGRVIRSRYDLSREATAALIRRNLRQVIESGTTTVADISTAGQSWDTVAESPVWGTVFAEVSWSVGCSGWARPGKPLRIGSPRCPPRSTPTTPRARPAPVSVPTPPTAPPAGFIPPRNVLVYPITSHIGEMPEEREFLTSRTGPLRGFVERLGAWVDYWKPVGPSPVDYLDANPAYRFSDWIVAHGNIINPDEFARLLVEKGNWESQRVAVAYCPRTHARFGHPPHPFRAMLAAGIVVCLGTDSLASTPTLSVLDEVRFLHRHHPDVPGSTLLAMATLNGAWAVSRDDQTGSLEPGKFADLAVLRLAGPRTETDPHSLWLDDNAPPLATMFRGQFVAGGLA